MVFTAGQKGVNKNSSFKNSSDALESNCKKQVHGWSINPMSRPSWRAFRQPLFDILLTNQTLAKWSRKMCKKNLSLALGCQ